MKSLFSRLNQNQAISFADFMQIALYAPQDGYYSSSLTKLGKQGDFTTAPELTPLFGQALANQCSQILSQVSSPCVFEFGAGTGKLCVALLNHLQQVHCLPETYYILEVSADLRQRQQELIQQEIPKLASRIQWLTHWPKTPFNGVVLANEVLDAMPVHRFMYTQTGIMESYISLDEQGQLVEQFKPCQNPTLINYLNAVLPAQEEPYISEANLFIEDWILNVYHMLHQGVALLIDYGFPRHEYYHPCRKQGSLMCHYQHRSHSNFLLHPGQQDITAHVDFTHVAETAHLAGFRIAGYTNQASFLLSNGLLSLVDCIQTQREQFKAKQAIKLLTHPSEMGELFKVIALSKGLEIYLTGFQLNDKRASL